MSLRVLSAQRYSARSYNNGTDPSQDPATNIFLLKASASNTFTDIGINSYSITNVGNVTSSNTTAKFANTYSASLSGSNYLSVADTVALRPGTGSFTWEFWWYPSTLVNFMTPLAKGYASEGDLVLQCGSDGFLYAYSSAYLVISNIAVTANAWNHVCLVRNENTFTIYINGVSGGSGTSSVNINSATSFSIGGSASFGGNYANGFMQDVRFVKSALYTADFTPPGSLS